MSRYEEVILVDSSDKQVGTMEKIEAHRKGVLHRAFSVFIFDKKNNLIIQKRAINKYHSGGLWSNTCCGHPNPGEDTLFAAKRRLFEEMGLKCILYYGFKHLYKANVRGGLIEYELDYVLFGITEDQPQPASSEVEDWAIFSIKELNNKVKTEPQLFTEWFKLLFNKTIEFYELQHMSI